MFHVRNSVTYLQCKPRTDNGNREGGWYVDRTKHGCIFYILQQDGQKDAEIPFIERRKKTNHNTKLAPPELLWQRRKARLSNFWTFCPR